VLAQNFGLLISLEAARTRIPAGYSAIGIALMERNPELGELLLDPAEAEQTRGATERARAIATLRKREEQFKAVVGELRAYRWRNQSLH
jgi:hypothetical protein